MIGHGGCVVPLPQPRWVQFPIGKIDHLAVQAWVTDLGTRLSPDTVAKCQQLTSGVLRAAVRD
jgi:hypothetical protein